MHGKMLFGCGADGVYGLYGAPDKRWSWVHVDDLGDAYARLLAAPVRAVVGEVYDIAEPSPPTYEALVRASNACAGFTGRFERTAPVGMEVYFDVTIVVDSAKARAALGWTPRHSIMRDLPQLAAAYKEAQRTPGKWA